MRGIGYLASVTSIALAFVACSSSDSGSSTGGAGGASAGGTGNATSGGGTGGSSGNGGTGNSSGNGGTGNAPGGGGTAGSPAGGGGTAGSAAGGGGTAGSASGGGGTGGGAVCGATGGTPGSCESSGQFDTCGNCIKAYCCSERQACLSTNPNDPCGWGGPAGFISEAQCFQKCFKQATAGGATISQAHATCSTTCVTPGCATLSTRTDALMSCLESSCLSECLT